jgi:hypothetical protein
MGGIESGANPELMPAAQLHADHGGLSMHRAGFIGDLN